jgi:hypothetical protein
MPTELYSSTKPAVPWRGVVLALGLLLAAGVLAENMVRARSGVHLTATSPQEGWQASFRVPMGFEISARGTLEHWQLARFSGPVDRANTADLFIWERPIEPGVSAKTLAEAVLAMTAVLVGQDSVQARPSPRKAAPLIGARRGVELWSVDTAVIARAAVDGNMAYGVSMSSSGPEVSDAAYARFDACCRSLGHEPGSRSAGD